MRTTDTDILILPGWGNSGPDHWQSRWQRNLKTARRIEMADWDKPLLADWTENIVAMLATAGRPPVIVAHSLGVLALAHVAGKLDRLRPAGAFLVAPPDLDAVVDIWPAKEGGFAPVPTAPLGVPATLIASSDDLYCGIDRARTMALGWGAKFIDAGPLGHINDASGHGPWPDGLLQFGLFLKSL